MKNINSLSNVNISGIVVILFVQNCCVKSEIKDLFVFTISDVVWSLIFKTLKFEILNKKQSAIAKN